MSYPARAEGLVNRINKNKMTCNLVDFVVPADHRDIIIFFKKLGQILGSCSRSEKYDEHEK